MLTRRTPLRRNTRHPRPKGPDADTTLTVLHRAVRDDKICCEVCSDPVDGERGFGWSLHHRRGRDGRADSNSVANLLVVCGSSNVDRCHGRIHSRRSESRPAGWWLSRAANEDPLTVPVLIDNGSRWVYLDNLGRYSDDPPGVAA
jgi:hypothetical protein